MNKEELIAFTKDTRIHIDKIINTVKKIDFPKAGRELALVVTNLQVGKMWLGKTLKAIGNPNPYPESRNPGSNKIEKPADSSNEVLCDHTQTIASIKYLRETVGNTIKNICDFQFEFAEATLGNENSKNVTEIDFNNVDYALKQLTEADMWLGMALGAIRDAQELNELKPV